MKTYKRRQFISKIDRGGHVYEHLRFLDCYFLSCELSATKKPKRRTRVVDVVLEDTEEVGCGIQCAILEDVTIHNLKTDQLHTWAAVFRHVRVTGRVGRIMISPLVAAGMASSKEQQAFDEANAAFYASVDWALDISTAEFEEADIRGVPAPLIVRDPESQVVLTRETAALGTWKELDLSGTHWATAIEMFLESGFPDKVLVAPKRNRNYGRLLAGLQLLRENGVVF